MVQDKILFVLSSHDKLLNGHPTGWYLPEAAHPYYELKDDFEIVFASPKGGKAPLDPVSVDMFKGDELCTKFLKDEEAKSGYEHTVKLSTVKASDFASVFYVGGHGPCFDLVDDKDSIALGEEIYATGKPLAAVCHGPVVFVNMKDRKTGKPIVEGKEVTCFSDAEEEEVKLTKAIPFLVETRLKELGAQFVKNDTNWGPRVVTDGNLLSGQNPASAGELGQSIKTFLSSL